LEAEQLLNDAAARSEAIHRLMGHRPVTAFADGDGDVPMLQYTSTDPGVKSFGLRVYHTDSQRGKKATHTAQSTTTP
jgi:hypothetical protein